MATKVMTQLSVDVRLGNPPVPGIWLPFSAICISPGIVQLMCRGNCLSGGMFQMNQVIVLLFQDILATASAKYPRGLLSPVVQCPWILYCYWSVSLVWSFNQLGLHSNGWSQFLHKPLPMPICFHYKGMLTPGLLKDSDVTFCSDGLCSSIFVFEDEGSYKFTAEFLANPNVIVCLILYCGSFQEYKAYALLKPTGSLSWIMERVLFKLLSEVATCYNHGTVLRNVAQ